MSARWFSQYALGVPWRQRSPRANQRVVDGFLPAVVLAAAFFTGCGGGVASGPPVIATVSISGSEGNYTLTVTGSGFGNPGVDVSLPYIGTLPNFRVLDVAQGADGEWGYSGDTNALTFLTWFDTQMQVSGFGGSPGDAVVLTLWNGASGIGAAWGGNVPPLSPGTPEITAVQFSGSGQSLNITVLGSGFGSAPVPMPYTGDLDQFFFEDERTPCSGSSLFNAGWTFWGTMPPGAVTLNFESWSDSKIEIGGFAGQYGQGCASVQPGDPIAIDVFNSGATGPRGGQTAWAGLVPTTPGSP